MTHSEYTTAVNTLHTYDHQYFTLNAPTVSDTEYDRLYFQVQQYEQENPADVLADSPTQRVYNENGNGRKQVALRSELLTIEKASSADKLAKWFKRTEKALKSSDVTYTVEWKYDGCTAALVYVDGDLVSAAHGHGAGFYANDCLEHVKMIPSVPQHIDTMGRVEVRGEIICPKSQLAFYGNKNERMASASVLNTQEAELGTCERLEFMAFYLDNGKTATYEEDYNELSRMGFKVGGIVLCNASEITDIIDQREQEREALSFPTDGLVIKVNDKSLWEGLGRTDHHRKYNVAYKFMPIYNGETTYTGYYTTVGEKTGKVTYVAQFETVTLNGVVCDHANCGSERTFMAKDLTPGDRIRVSLHGDVVVYVDGKVNGTTEGTENNSTTNDANDANTPVIEPVNNHGSMYMTAEEIDALLPAEDEHTPRYATIEEINALIPTENDFEHQEEDKKKLTTKEKFLVGALTFTAVASICIVGVAAVGAAAFLTPVLAGTLLK